MAVAVPARLVDVKCPMSGHVLFQAASEQFGTVLAKVCKCGRLVYGDHARHLETCDIPRR